MNWLLVFTKFDCHPLRCATVTSKRADHLVPSVCTVIKSALTASDIVVVCPLRFEDTLLSYDVLEARVQ